MTFSLIPGFAAEKVNITETLSVQREGLASGMELKPAFTNTRCRSPGSSVGQRERASSYQGTIDYCDSTSKKIIKLGVGSELPTAGGSQR